MLPAPIVQFPLQIRFQFTALLKWGIQYIERDFACIWFRFFSWWLKAWPACCPLPVLSSSQGDPPPPLFPGWSSVRVKWVEKRQGYRLQPSPTLVVVVHPLTVPVSGALRHTAVLLHTPKYLHVYIFPSFILLSGVCAIVFAKAKQGQVKLWLTRRSLTLKSCQYCI